MDTADTHYEPVPKPAWRQKLLQYNIVRFLAAAAFIVSSLALLNVLTGYFLTDPDLEYLRNILKLLVGVGAYVAYVRLVEMRPVAELALLSAWKEWLAGIVIGVLLFIVVLGILAMVGVFHIDGFNDPAVMQVYVIDFITVAFLEEIIFRAVVFRLLEASLGSVIALLISSLFFGFAHISNPGATWFSSLAIALEAGFTFGAIYMLTRRLALCIGLHFAWNFTQGAVFSVAVSGVDSKGWMQSRMTGLDLLTGGSFGAEASIVMVFFATLIGIAFLYLAWQKGQFKQGFWKRPAHAEMPDGRDFQQV